MTKNALTLSVLLAACGGETYRAEAEIQEEARPRVSFAPEIVRQEAPEPTFVLETLEEAPAPLEIAEVVVEEGPTTEIEVRHGESLVQIAEWAGLRAEEIAWQSGVDVQATIYSGQALLLLLDEDGARDLERKRNHYEDTRLDNYLERRGGLLAVGPYAVGTGDTAWEIARENGSLPVWVLAAFNRNTDLDRLQIGQQIHLPVLGDSVTVTELEITAEE
jgi:hypothetical protein